MPRESTHAYPATHEEFMEYLHEQRAKAELEHARRMKAWTALQSEEHLREIQEDILNSTHADMQPPWLAPTEEQDNAE